MKNVLQEKNPLEKKVKALKESSNLVKELRNKVPDHGLRMKYYNKTIGKNMMGKKPDGKMGYTKLFLTLKRKYRKDMAEKGEADVALTKELQKAPLNFALERALDRVSKHNKTNSSKNLLKKDKVRRIVYNIYKHERISFKGKTKIEFTEKETYKLMKELGISNGREFIEIFKKNLKEEVGWARHYIRDIIDPAAVLAKWQ